MAGHFGILCRYGLPVNFQAMLLRPQKKMSKRLRDVLNQLYSHLDNSAYTGGGAVGGDVSRKIKSNKTNNIAESLPETKSPLENADFFVSLS